jgi:cell division protein FtsL
MNIDAQIDTLSRVLVTVLGVAILVVSAALLYIISLCMELHQEIRRHRTLRQKQSL